MVTGKLDYAIATSSNDPDPSAPFLLILEAKVELPRFSYCQLLSQMYASYEENNRRASHAKPMYGVLTNEVLWEFYRINADRTWQKSVAYNFPSQLKEIVGILVGIIRKQGNSSAI
jgi:hypothetical protein